MKTKKVKKKSKLRSLLTDPWIMTATGFGLLGIAAIFYPWNTQFGKHLGKYFFAINDYEKLGTFVSGISTPLFGLATVILLVRTYTLQKQELSETVDMFQKQRFEDTFFRLLENHQRIVETMDLRKNEDATSIIASSRDCFKTFWKRMDDKIDEAIKKGESVDADDINKIYDDTQDFYKGDLHHYFRFLYHILKYVKNAEIEEEEKYKYTSILRATLSPYELALIFYNCLHEFGDSHFKPLVEEFSFLKNLDNGLLFLPDHEAEYNELAFASSEKRPVLLLKWREEMRKEKERGEMKQKEEEEKQNVKGKTKK